MVQSMAGLTAEQNKKIQAGAEAAGQRFLQGIKWAGLSEQQTQIVVKAMEQYFKEMVEVGNQCRQ